MTNPIDIFKSLSQEDRAALAKLREEYKQKLGREVSISDMIRAVTPGLETPDYLR